MFYKIVFRNFVGSLSPSACILRTLEVVFNPLIELMEKGCFPGGGGGLIVSSPKSAHASMPGSPAALNGPGKTLISKCLQTPLCLCRCFPSSGLCCLFPLSVSSSRDKDTEGAFLRWLQFGGSVSPVFWQASAALGDGMPLCEVAWRSH